MKTHKNRLFFIKTLTLMLLFFSYNSYAVLKIEITEGIDGTIPIGIKAFTLQTNTAPPVNLKTLIENNLTRSGLFITSSKIILDAIPSVDFEFKEVKNLGLDYFVIGNIKKTLANNYIVSFQLFDVFKNLQLIGVQYTISKNDFRALGHKISDLIYEKIIGKKGAFSSQILYVSTKISKNNTREYLLNIADSDGFNPKVILNSPEPIMSPTWSASGKHIAYVSFENRKATVYIQNVKKGTRNKITSLDGINGAPSFSPDGKKLAVTLSFQGNAEVYIIDIETKQKTRFTKNSGIDTEPSWMPDSQAIVFTSDRSGSAQLYIKNIQGGRAKRLTFEGRYNASASISADGQYIALVHLNNKKYQIAILALKTQSLRIISDGVLDESPSFAPNDSMIMYGSEKKNVGVFGAVSFDGRMKQIFSIKNETIREPVWSPFID